MLTRCSRRTARRRLLRHPLLPRSESLFRVRASTDAIRARRVFLAFRGNGAGGSLAGLGIMNPFPSL